MNVRMIDWMDNEILGNPIATWITALLIGFLAAAVLGTLKRLLRGRLKRIAFRTRTPLDNLLYDLVDKTNVLFILLLGLYVGAQWLTFEQALEDLIRRVLLYALLAQLGLWGSGMIDYVISRNVEESTQEDGTSATTLNALGVVGKVVLWVVVVLIALDNMPNVEVNTLIASLGIGGVAAALAVQNILGDLFASLSIALDKPFEIGDFLIIGGDMGNIERIGIRSTRIRSLSGEQLIVSNSDLLNSRIRNYKRMSERRISFSFGVIYETAYEQLVRIPDIVREVIEEQALARFDRAHFKAYGDFSLDFEVVYYVLSETYNDYMDLQQAINFGLFQRFEQEGIEFAYPTQLIYMGGNTE